jgi:translation initiation factor IF-3
LSRPFPSRSSWSGAPQVRVNGKIRAREVRVIGADGQQLGVLQLADAIRQAQALGVDLVEIAPNATPPVCRIVDYGKFRYEQAKKDKESKKHQHANKVKEVQLSPQIDPHDFGVKLTHAIDFLCEDLKVKVTLKFRGREMAHKEFGFQQVNNFIKELTPWGHPDFEAKLIGKGINVMISPLPRNKRAKHPAGDEGAQNAEPPEKTKPRLSVAPPPSESSASAPAFSNSPFAQLNTKTGT